MATAKKDTEKKTAEETTAKAEAAKKRKVKKVPDKEVKPTTSNVDTEQPTPVQTSEPTADTKPTAKEAANEEPNPTTADVDVEQSAPEISAEQEEVEKKAEEETDTLFHSSGIMLGKSDKEEEGEVKTVEDIIKTKETPTAPPPKKNSIGKRISTIMQYAWNGQVMD